MCAMKVREANMLCIKTIILLYRRAAVNAHNTAQNSTVKLIQSFCRIHLLHLKLLRPFKYQIERFIADVNQLVFEPD